MSSHNTINIELYRLERKDSRCTDLTRISNLVSRFIQCYRFVMRNLVYMYLLDELTAADDGTPFNTVVLRVQSNTAYSGPIFPVERICPDAMKA